MRCAFVNNTFQFQTGAIKSRNGDGDIGTNKKRFNSKLVRLKDKIADGAVTEPKVSIPNWCD